MDSEQKKPKVKKEKKEKKPQGAFKKHYRWFIFIIVFSFSMALAFGLATEAFTGMNSIIICCVIIFVLIAIAFMGDVFAVAVITADIENFNAMASRKLKGAKMSIRLIKNGDKVSSILSDILGDVCGIVSGAMGVALSLVIIGEGNYSFFMQGLIIALVNAAIATIAITAKSVAKKIAIKNSNAIVLTLGKMLSKFSRSR